ncbi:MAG: RDD family protein [Flavisolibacter sp.]|nr:RDD family protein [Flavisolibacter sp.]MBD0296844.1 RDD family protein [Flavisolibacter sp.]MBD0375580.1 RDD family protein [Flavisolibacter sp.]
MSILRIETHFNIDLEFAAPPFHRRLLAWVLDLFILIFYLLIAVRVFDWLWRITRNSDDKLSNFWAVSLFLFLPLFIYHPVCEILLNGQSVGKRIMGIRVVNEKGGKPSISQYIIRWLIRTSDYMALMIILYAPYIAIYGAMVLWGMGGAFALLVADVILVNATRKHQRLGDILAHTLLIRTSERAHIEDTIFLAVAENYTPSFPQVMQLSDRDINTIKTILDTSRKKYNYKLADMASQKIKTHLHIESSLSPFDFLEVLLKDYNYLATR